LIAPPGSLDLSTSCICHNVQCAAAAQLPLARAHAADAPFSSGATADHPLPDGWVLQRRDECWQATNGFHATMLHYRREDAIAAAREAVRLFTVEGRP
jgi:hypothetical protein